MSQNNNNNFRQNQQNAVMDWVKSVPLITKMFFFPTFIFGAMATYGMVTPYSLILYWPGIWSFQIWRLVTPFLFVGKFSFNFAMHLYMIYSYFPRYEANPYNTGAGGSVADVLWMVILSMGLLLIAGYFLELMLLGDPILFVIIYLWSRKDSESIVSIFGFKFKAAYVPWVYLALNILMGSSIVPPLSGIVVGHTYFYFVEVFPVIYGYQLIKTPKFCRDAVPLLLRIMPTQIADNNSANQQFQPRNQAPTQPTGGNNFGGTPNLRNRAPAANDRPATYNWGQGRALGSQ
jgi:hypothetical protein